MTFTKVSVLVPTRGRVDRLKTLIASFEQTTARLHDAELVFRIDDDDPESDHALAETPYRVLRGPRLDGYRSLPVFFNQLAAFADGDVLMCGNDDMVFRTLGWSARVLAVANQYPDGLFDLGVLTHNAMVFPFSIVSRLAVYTMGYVHDPRVFWGDVFLRDVMATFGRAIPLPDVQIDHDWAGHRPDQTFREAGQDNPTVWDETYWTRHMVIVKEAVARLRPLAVAA